MYTLSVEDEDSRPYITIQLPTIDRSCDMTATYAHKLKAWIENELDAHWRQIEDMIDEARAEVPAPTLAETRVDIWQERDRLMITLKDARTDFDIVTWCDEAAREAIEDTTIQISNRSIGRLRENDPAILLSAYEYARDHGMLDRSFTGDRDIRAIEEEPEDAAAAVECWHCGSSDIRPAMIHGQYSDRQMCVDCGSMQDANPDDQE